jgi:Cu/Ag efflux pump CusA
MNPQVTVYQNNQITMQVEKILMRKPEIERVYTNVGSTGTLFGNSAKNNSTSISVKMVGGNAYTELLNRLIEYSVSVITICSVSPQILLVTSGPKMFTHIHNV